MDELLYLTGETAEAKSQEKRVQPTPAPRAAPAPSVPEGQEPPNKILFVQNLPDATTDMMLSMLFQQYVSFLPFVEPLFTARVPPPLSLFIYLFSSFWPSLLWFSLLLESLFWNVVCSVLCCGIVL